MPSSVMILHLTPPARYTVSLSDPDVLTVAFYHQNIHSSH